MLKPGDMLGHQNLSEMSGTFMEETWKFDVVCEADACIALLPFGEYKTEIRKNAKAVSTRLNNLADVQSHGPGMQDGLSDVVLQFDWRPA